VIVEDTAKCAAKPLQVALQGTGLGVRTQCSKELVSMLWQWAGKQTRQVGPARRITPDKPEQSLCGAGDGIKIFF
jgi:hypothetical protein